MMNNGSCGMDECNCSRARFKALEREMGRVTNEVFEPIPKEYGVYYLNLQVALDAPGAPSSKEILIPFFEKGNFKKLEIDCSHIPRWFDTGLPKYHLTALAGEGSCGFFITVTPEVIK